ncbi:MAG: hypothetical protein CSA50_02855 [Gammaproteobacteria bacterium]|nr:MAG: hypothetical protein CSA50_02855 [Gammaproteobacteria bacterium]
MKTFSQLKTLLITLVAVCAASSALAADSYKIDTKGAHAFIQFKIKHLGYSWLYGRFDRFNGSLKLDEKHPENSSIEVTVDVTSVNSNHAERDKHLRGSDFLDVKQFPTARFVSTSVEATDKNTAVVTGNMTLHGVTKAIRIPVTRIGAGSDPWGGYRQGFSGSVTLKLKDYGIDYNLGPASTEVELTLDIEAIKQQ